MARWRPRGESASVVHDEVWPCRVCVGSREGQSSILILPVEVVVRRVRGGEDQEKMVWLVWLDCGIDA